MSILLTPPRTKQPLLASLQSRREGAPNLSDYPDLALAATATTADLDTEGEAFGAVLACLETIGRLRLSASSTRLLMLLVKHGPQTCSVLVSRMKISSAAMTGLVTRLAALSLVGVQRDLPDRRSVTVTATPAARKVLASIVALSALGGAAYVLNQIKA